MGAKERLVVCVESGMFGRIFCAGIPCTDMCADRLDRSMIAIITDMIHDKPMNMSTWITDDGRAYMVQKIGVAVCNVSSESWVA